jgi:two-component system alkaline phosphatase synthesis response regulator PhoP
MAKTAFVVDDEENIREIIRCSVESCGLSVCGFEDALQMLNELSRRTPEIIILDIMLPGIDGLEALRRIKSNPATASIPVIMLTAKSSETDKVAGLDLGADDYITKPFGVLELMARIRAALRHSSTQTENNTIFEHRGLVLDLGRHEVFLNDMQIELTLKEFELLKKLMENAGKVILRNTLLDEVWGYGYGGETRTLDMHIRSLRQKLNDDSSSSGYISTVRGVGYKFNS